MSWTTEHADQATRLFLAAEAEHPYLTALLLSNEKDADRVHMRTRNWLSVRAGESAKPDTVAGMPYHVVLDPASACNLRCPLCVQATDPGGRSRTLIDVEHFQTVVRQNADYMIRLDLFNWGEPLLHPRFIDLVRFAAGHSLYTRTSSHMSHQRAIDWPAIVASGLRYLVASIDGATQATYERYRIGGRLDLALRNLGALVEAKREAASVFPIVEWQYLVNAFNVDEIDEARALAEAIGVNVFRFGGARGVMSLKTLVSAADAFQRSKKYLVAPEHPLSEYDSSGNKRRISEREGCRWLWGKVALQADGGVTPCWNGWFSRYDIGNWHSDSLADIWNGSDYRQRRAAVRAGGSESGHGQCERCAFQRNFVPTPDSDDEPVPTASLIDDLTAALSTVAQSPTHPVRDAILDATLHGAVRSI